jgi:hypothetical protein
MYFGGKVKGKKSEEAFTDSLETRVERFTIQMGSLVPDLKNLLKSRGFKEVILHRIVDIQALTGTSDRGQTHIFAKAFHVSRDKLCFVVHAHGIIFPSTVCLTGSILAFTYSLLYFIKVFQVSDLNN